MSFISTVFWWWPHVTCFSLLFIHFLSFCYAPTLIMLTVCLFISLLDQISLLARAPCFRAGVLLCPVQQDPQVLSAPSALLLHHCILTTGERTSSHTLCPDAGTLCGLCAIGNTDLAHFTSTSVSALFLHTQDLKLNCSPPASGDNGAVFSSKSVKETFLVIMNSKDWWDISVSCVKNAPNQSNTSMKEKSDLCERGLDVSDLKVGVYSEQCDKPKASCEHHVPTDHYGWTGTRGLSSELYRKPYFWWTVLKLK